MKIFFRKGLSAILLGGILIGVLVGGCRPAGGEPVEPTLTLPTIIELTAGLATPQILETPTKTAMKTPPVRLDLTPTQPATIQPPVAKTQVDPPVLSPSLSMLDPIQIRSPGMNSKVVSPIIVEAQWMVGEAANAIRMEVWGENGVLLARQVVDPARLTAPGDHLVESIDFEISTESQDVWLIIGLDDAPNSPLAVNSIPIKLLASGEPIQTDPTWQAKTIDIQQPAPDVVVAGGEIAVSGLANLPTGQLLKLQVLGPGGKLLSQGLLAIEGAPEDGYKPFATRLFYSVDQLLPARLVVFSELVQSGIVHYLSSVPITLVP